MKKNTISRCLVLLLLSFSLGSLKAQELKRSQLNISYQRSHLTFLDRQASPLIYESDLNGATMVYEHNASKSRSFLKLQANLGTALPKNIGLREFTLTNTNIYGETTTNILVHAPTVYTGQLEAGYLRRLKTGGSKSIFVGGTLQDWITYSDNIGFWSTMGINTASLNAAIQLEKAVTNRQQLKIGASFPVAAIVSRMPYSNSISDPERGNFKAFFAEGSRLVFLNQLQRVSFGAAYQYQFSCHWGTGVAYDFYWLHYTQPRPVYAFNHSLKLQLNLIF
jgi:hypothetical protein